MVKKICEICGKEYLVKNYRKETSKYCSKKCQGKACYDKNLASIDKTYLIGNTFRKGMPPPKPFAKGHTPWNKGLKGIHLSKETEFKKGIKSINHKEVGEICLRKEKNDKERNYIKVAEPDKWELYPVYLVKQAGFEIPKGSVVHHINKNCLDDRIENLQILTRAEHINIHREDWKK